MTVSSVETFIGPVLLGVRSAVAVERVVAGGRFGDAGAGRVRVGLARTVDGGAVSVTLGAGATMGDLWAANARSRTVATSLRVALLDRLTLSGAVGAERDLFGGGGWLGFASFGLWTESGERGRGFPAGRRGRGRGGTDGGVGAISARGGAEVVTRTPRIVPGLLNAFVIGCSVSSGPTDGLVAVGVAVGAAHSCVLTAEGDVWCWGDDRYGQIGVDTSTAWRSARRVWTPTRVPVSRVEKVVAGWAGTCAVPEGERGVLCWGQNWDERYWSGERESLPNSVPVPTELFPRSIVRDVGVSLGVICIVTDGGAVECRGSDEYAAQTGSRLLADSVYPGRYRSVFVGTMSYCAVSVDNRAFCWGQNEVGQICPDTNADKLTRPTWVADNVASVVVGRTHGCAVLLDGNVRCWGRDLFGAVADTVRSQVGRVNAVAMGTLGTWLLNERGEIWPLGTPHPLARGSDVGPVNAQFRARQIATGFGHSCALADDGAVWCWGANVDGEVGTGFPEASPTPVRVFPIE
jgi:alpha-tubulin suppressor-like RCC1 family protein